MPIRALDIMEKEKQPHLPCGIGPEGTAVMLKDIADADGRVYRVEFQSTLNAKRSVAIIRHNPWSTAGQGPDAGMGYQACHVSPTGFVCLGSHHATESVADSEYPLEDTIKRLGYFVNALSYTKETGKPFPQP